MDLQAAMRRARLIGARQAKARELTGLKCLDNGCCGTWSAGECKHCKKNREVYLRLADEGWMPPLYPVDPPTVREHAADRIARLGHP